MRQRSAPAVGSTRRGATVAALALVAWGLTTVSPVSAGGLAPTRCDFDADGYDDLAIGVPGEAVGSRAGAGALNVIYGSGTRLNATGNQLWHQDSSGVEGVSEVGDAFGAALACGDFDDDNFDDLAIGAPFEDVGSRQAAGAVNVLYGSSTGLSSLADQLWHQDQPSIAGGAEAADMFGAALAAGDFDGDGTDDLAIGIPGECIGTTCGAGAFAVLYGTPGGLSAAGNQFFDQSDAGGAVEGGDRFGESLAAGDFDGDRRDDLAVGSPGEDITSGAENRSDAGAVAIFYGSGTGLATAGAQVWHQDSPGIKGVVEAYDLFGHALASGDFDNDGDDDLAVGAPRESVGSVSRAGAVHVILGSGNGLTAAGDELWHQDTSGIKGVAESGDVFGLAIVAGDFDGDHRDDLAVGIPGEDVGTGTAAGAVAVLFGGGSGLTAADQLVHQDTAGIKLDAESGDAFGTTLGVGNFNNFNGSGFDDLAIGVPGESIGTRAPRVSAGAVNVIYGGGTGLTTTDQVWHQNRSGIAGAAEDYDRLAGEAASAGVYRIGYEDGTSVKVGGDHLTHKPVTRIDMSGQGGGPYMLAAAGDGWIRIIQDEFQEPTDNNNYVWIEHPNGEWTKYTHMERNSVDDLGLVVDQWVTAGTVIGIEGDVGKASGDHLHFEVAIPRDPNNPVTTGGFIRGINLIPIMCGIAGNIYRTGETYTSASC